MNPIQVIFSILCFHDTLKKTFSSQEKNQYWIV